MAYYLIKGNESVKFISALAADVPKRRFVVDELKKDVAKTFSFSLEDLVVFDSLESLEKYRQAQASGNPESAPEVGFIWIESHVDISLTNDAAPRSHHGPRPQTKVLDLDSSW